LNLRDDPERMRVYKREWMARRRAEFFEDKACVGCGATDRLELDHVDPATKLHHAIWSWANERREAEIAKCLVRCRACHIARHQRETQQHGTVSRYQAGCRCDPCRAAKAAKNRRERDRRKAQPGSAPGSLSLQESA